MQEFLKSISGRMSYYSGSIEDTPENREELKQSMKEFCEEHQFHIVMWNMDFEMRRYVRYVTLRITVEPPRPWMPGEVFEMAALRAYLAHKKVCSEICGSSTHVKKLEHVAECAKSSEEEKRAAVSALHAALFDDGEASTWVFAE